MKKKNIFLDMDLTLVKFPCEHGERGTKRYRLEEGFFYNLLPYQNIELINEAIEAAIASGTNVYTLSNSPTEQADFDKGLWLDKYLPAVPKENRIFNRGFLHHGKPKPEVASEVLGRKLEYNDVLIDDCLEILIAWQRAGGIAIKKHVRGEKAGEERPKWYGERMSYLRQIADYIHAN